LALSRLTDGLGYFLGLALAETDATALVTDDDERGKAETLTTLDGLGHAVDRDQTVSEFRGLVALVAAVAPTVVISCHLASSFFCGPLGPLLVNPGGPSAPGSSRGPAWPSS